MSRFWSRLTHDLKPYVPGEQPRIAELVKLNTNESPFGPSPRALEAIRGEAADTLRLYPDPQASVLRAALATYHQVRPEQVFVGNGSDEVLAHAFAALLKHDAPLLFPDITYSFYPVYCRLFGITYEAVPLDQAMQIRSSDYRRPAGAIIVPNPNAPTGVALSRAEIAALLEQHPDVPVVIDEAYVDFGAETAIPLVASHPNLLVVQTMPGSCVASCAISGVASVVVRIAAAPKSANFLISFLRMPLRESNIGAGAVFRVPVQAGVKSPDRCAHQ